MTSIDTDRLLMPLSGDAPCGENLEYDPAFGELERAALGTPERVSGNETKPAEPPDWNDVLEKSLSLFDRTKDTRVAVHLLEAGLWTSGLPALTAGLTLLHRLVADHWDSVHPQLDKEDGDDPTLRMNTLLALNDRSGVAGALSRCPLVQSKAFGRVTLRDVRVASGELASNDAGSQPLDGAQIDAAFLDGDLAELQANAAAAEAAVAESQALQAFLNERVGASRAPDLNVLVAELRAVHGVLAAQLARRGVGQAAEGDGAAGHAEAPQRAAVGDINSREDVVRAIDRICDYFRKNEPSSPVPLLLQRAKGLVSKDFMDILRDLTPDGLSQAQVIVGPAKEE